MAEQLKYMTGFGNEFETEALPGALPIGQFTPQKVKYDLYTCLLYTSPSPRDS